MWLQSMDNKNIILLGEAYLIPGNKIVSLTEADYQLIAIKAPLQQKEAMPTLTLREHRCLEYFALDCLAVKQIANKMAITDRAVRSILEVLRIKFACDSNSAIIAKYYRAGWHHNR